MFLFEKALVPFLLPPGAFVTLLFGLGLWNLKKPRQNRSYGYFIAAGLMWLVLTRPFGNAAVAGLEYAFLPPAEVKADVIIALGGGVNDGAPGEPGDALKWPSLERAAAAARLYRRYKLPIIVSGGPLFAGAADGPAMKSWLEGAGVPAEKVFVEERARNTYENAVFTKKICEEKGYKKAVLVTSAVHMRRSAWCFEKAGFTDLTPYPAGYKSSKAYRRHFIDYLPGTGESLRLAVHEYLGLLFYRVRY